MAFNSPVANRLARPGGVFVDRVSTPNRLYVYDAGNNRILGFSDIGVLQPNQSVTTGTAWSPDIVLGQADFTHTAANGDSQLQGFPGFPFANYLSSTDPLPDPTASTLCLLDPRVVSPGESGSNATLAVDALGNLYVPDYWNNRVLRYDAPTATGEAASHVWGQVDFTHYRPNRGGAAGNGTFSFMNQRGFLAAGVAIDAWGNLWVTDTGNDRVMRFPNPNAPAPGVPAAVADVILGQTGVEAVNDLDMGHFYYPGSVRVDASGNVFVADGPPASGAKAQGGRVLIFKPQSLGALGVPQYANGQAPSGSVTLGLVWPTGLEFDPSGDLWVNDFGDTQIILYHMNTTAVPPTGTPVRLLLRSQLFSGAGSPLDASTADNADFRYAYPPGSVMSANSPEYHHDNCGGLGVDSAGDVFAVFSDPIIDCMRYPAPIPGLAPSGAVTAVNLPGAPLEAHAPDVAVFKSFNDPDVGGINNVITDTSVGALGLAVAASASVTQLIAAESRRLTYWNLDPSNPPSLGLVNGKAADGFAGTTASTVNYLAGESYGRICADQAPGQTHLWTVHGDNNNLWVEAYNLPLTPWKTGSVTLQPPFPILGGGSLNCGSPGNRRMDGIAVDPTGNTLWLSDTINNRVIRVRNALGAAPGPTPCVDIILGQAGAAATLANRGGAEGAATLNQPGALAYDHHGNLYVSDYSLEANGNARLLEFDASTVQNASAVNCVFGVAASHVYAENGNLGGTCQPFSDPSLSPCGPWQPAFRSDDQVMVVGTMGYSGSRWPVVFQFPLTNFNQPTTYLDDFESMGAYSGVFDAQDNYYMTDPDRGRVLVYWHPFPTVLTPVPTPCACPTTLVNYGANGAGGGNGVVNGAGQIAEGATNGVTYLYIADINNNRVERFNAATGAWTANLAGSGTYGMSSPYGAALGPGGHYLYVANTNGANVEILDLTAGGAPVTAFTSNHPVRVAVDAASAVYVTDDTTVRKYVPGSPNNYSCVVTLGTPGVSGSGPTLFNKPYNVMPLGNDLYVADNANARIVRWTTPDGVNYAYAETMVASGAAFGQMALEPGTTHVHVGSDNGAYFIYDLSTSPWTLLFQCYPGGSGTDGVAVDSAGLYLSAAPGAPAAKFNLPLQPCLTPVTLPTHTPTLDLTHPPTNTPTNTWTPTPTPSPTPTASPSASPTPSATATPTHSPTLTATKTPTSTPTPSATFTRSPTSTLSPTWTPTGSPTGTPTPGSPVIVISPPYPNPVKGSPVVSVRVQSPGDSEAAWDVFTTAYRKVAGGTRAIPGDGILQWGLKDDRGTPVAAGLYYFRVRVTGHPSAVKILKVLVLK